MPHKPNILVFMTDDHGQWASSAYGNKELHTPAMQWLADTGARMNHAFCPSPVCSPARASFFTGRIPSFHGIHDWIDDHREDPELPHIEGNRNIAEYLKEAGYQTGLVGKWHCGQFWKKQAGFDTWFTSAMGTNATFGKQAYFEDEERLEFHGHQETILTDRAVRFLKDRSDAGEKQPFFLFVGYTNTHTPHSGEEEDVVEKYRHSTFDDIPDESYNGEHGHARIAPFDKSEPDRREQLAQYYAAVDVIDQQMTRIFSELKNNGELENTLIIYTSDHGHMNGHHGLHTKANATVPVNFLDESIHVPLLLRWPGHIPASTTLDAFVDHCDLFATLLDVAGTHAQEVVRGKRCGASSYLPMLTGHKQNWRDYQICEYAYSRMIRTADHKLIRRYPTKVMEFENELYDLETDPRENTNIFGRPETARMASRLGTVLDDYFDRYADPEKAGINMDTILFHNQTAPWEIRPGDHDHRQ